MFKQSKTKRDFALAFALAAGLAAVAGCSKGTFLDGAKQSIANVAQGTTKPGTPMNSGTPHSAPATSAGGGSAAGGAGVPLTSEEEQIVADLGDALVGTDGSIEQVAQMHEELDIILGRY